MVEDQDKYIYGYKCFNSDMTNRYGKKFELGKVYSTDGKVKFGNSGNGFHFCKNIEDTLRYFSLSDYLLRDKELSNLFTKQQYVEIINKFYKTVVDMNETYFYIDTYNDFLKYFKENDKKEYQRLLKKYCDFVFANLANIDDRLKQTELQKVRQYMDDLEEYDDKDYQIIDCELERVNKEQLSKLKRFSISLPDEQFHQIKKEIERNTKVFESLSSSNKIFKLIIETFPLSLEELRKNYEDSKKGLFALLKENILDQDGRVINFNELSDEQNFSLKVTQNIGLRVDIYFDLIFMKPVLHYIQHMHQLLFCYHVRHHSVHIA